MSEASLTILNGQLAIELAHAQERIGKLEAEVNRQSVITLKEKVRAEKAEARVAELEQDYRDHATIFDRERMRIPYKAREREAE